MDIPVSAVAMTCPAAANTSTEPAAACASTSMSTIVAEGVEGAMARPDAVGSPTGPVAARASTSVSTVADEGMVAEPDGGAASRWVAVEIPEGELIKCNLCYVASTYICANATVDDEYRASCLKMQGGRRAGTTENGGVHHAHSRNSFRPTTCPKSGMSRAGLVMGRHMPQRARCPRPCQRLRPSQLRRRQRR